jgi:hypothetical protein
VFTQAAVPDSNAAKIVDCQPPLHQEGLIRVRMIVGKDGLPEPGTISAVNQTTHKKVEEARIAFARCVFTPARHKGAPVRQVIDLYFTVGETQEPNRP